VGAGAALWGWAREQGGEGARQGPRREEERVGEGERERERERGSSPRQSKLRRYPFQDLGHHGEREREGWKREREVTAREKSNERKRSGGGGRVHGEGRGRQGRQGRAGRTGPSWATPRIQTHDTHDH
jgi:hypothetical protein